MKQLHEYETPETDEAAETHPTWTSSALLHGHKLEQRLAACRETLELIANGPWVPQAWTEMAKDTLEKIKQ